MKRLWTVLLAAGLALAAGVALPVAAQVAPALDRELARLPRLGTVLYVTAHPDDESGAVLTYLARGMNARVVLIAMTRGEGGQNSEGSEIGEELGWIRQRELDAAGAAYGAEVRVLGAPDFGYSKDVEETLEIWDTDEILRQLCYQIRTLRPVAIFSAWSSKGAGGGSHHQAAGILTEQAYAMAGDSEAFPEQLSEGLLPWETPYLLVRDWSGQGEGTSVDVPANEIVPGSGRTYEELGWEGFRNHRSQGMAGAGRQLSSIPAEYRRYTQRVIAVREGLSAPESIAEAVPTLSRLTHLFHLFPESEEGEARRAEWNRKLTHAETLAQDARAMAAERPSAAIRDLLEGARELASLRSGLLDDEEMTLDQGRAEAWLSSKQQSFFEAAAELAGISLRALAANALTTPGDVFDVRAAMLVGTPALYETGGFRATELTVTGPAGWSVEKQGNAAAAGEREAVYRVEVPADADFRTAAYPLLEVRVKLAAGDLKMELVRPVLGVWTDPEGSGLESFLEKLDPRRIDPSFFDPRRLFRIGRQRGPDGGEELEAVQLEPVRLAPALSFRVEPELALVSTAGGVTHDFRVRLESNRSVRKGTVWMNVPSGWFSPEPQRFELPEARRRAARWIPLTYPGKLEAGRQSLSILSAEGNRRYTQRWRRIERGPHPDGGQYPPIYVVGEVRAEVEVVDTVVPAGLRVGYIGFPDDPVPGLLEGLGVDVMPLREGSLDTVELAGFDAIVVANRTYDSRSDLLENNQRLLDYAFGGGVLLVEHQGRSWNPGEHAPYPGKKPDRPVLRVTDETAAVSLLSPAHPLLRFPNPIGEDDWKGWVQERGLFFWEEWDEHYTPLLEMADPGAGEGPLRGSLLYARHGRGVYIYCGLALFRQVRAGVPGGIRLYMNLLSQGRALRSGSTR